MPDLEVDIYQREIQIDVQMAGAPGIGLVTGGTAGQVLTKQSATNYDAFWKTLAKSDVGLSNVDNTSDINKPVSTAQAAAIDLRQYKMTVVVGANGDYQTNGTNDAAQINAAVAFIRTMSSTGYGIVDLPDETYNINTIINLEDGIWFRGAGMHQTILNGTSTLGNNAVMLGTATISAPLTDCIVSDLKIDGTNMDRSTTTTFKKGIDVLYTNRMRVFNVYIYNTPSTGFGPDCNISFLVDNCIFEKCGTLNQNPGFNGLGIGTGFYENESCLVSNCVAIDCYNNGFLLEYVGGLYNSRDYMFTNCYAIGNKRGFRVSGASGATFMNCKALNSTFEGYYIQAFGAYGANPTDIKVIGCDAYYNNDSGFYFKDQEYGQLNLICEGNTAIGNKGDGIVSGGRYAQIKNNVCAENDYDGIFYHANSGVAIGDAQITGNIAYNNGKALVSGRGDGIRVHGELGPIDSVNVSGNQCFDNQSVLSITDGSISSTVNPTRLTSTAAGWKTTDVGKPITVVGAGSGGADLVTTIQGYLSASTVYLTDPALTTVSGTTATYGSSPTQQYGITVKDSVTNVAVSGNICHDNTKSGIFYQISINTQAYNARIIDNTCFNNGKAGVATATDGIRVWGSSLGTIEGVLVRGNRCFDNQSVKTQSYGIAIKDNVTEALIKDNDVRGNATGGILDDPTAATATNTYVNNKGYNPDELYAQGNVTGATTFNQTNGSTITATLTGNVTATVTAGKSINSTLTLILAQDATGSRTISWPSNVKLAQGGLTLSTAASSVDIVKLIYDGTNWREISRALSAVTVGSAATSLVDSNSVSAVTVTAVASAVNNFNVSNAATGNSPTIAPTGTDAAIGMLYLTKSTGRHIFRPGSNATNAFSVQNAAGSTSVLNVDTTNTRVGISQGTPTSTLHVTGSFATKVGAVTSAFTATSSDSTITGDSTSGAFTVTLPTAASISGRIYTIKKIDASANAVTVGTTSSQTIDGSTTYPLSSQWKFVMVQSDGANWIIIGAN